MILITFITLLKLISNKISKIDNIKLFLISNNFTSLAKIFL
jgi:hypothetical protein